MPMRVLVVEDDRFIREVIALVLRAETFDVDVAEDGEIALRYLSERVPSLVILDLALPCVDGLTILRKLRANPLTSRVPVLVASAVPNESVATVALEAGANVFLHKPFDVSDLVRIAHRLVEPADTSVSAPASVTQPESPLKWRIAAETRAPRDKPS